MVDFVMYVIVIVIFWLALQPLGVSTTMGTVIAAVVLFGAETALVTLRGASIGKLIVGERVTDPNGQPVTLGAAALRTTPRLLYVHPYIALLAVALGAVSAAMIYATEDRRSVMDRIARTVVRQAPTGG